VFADQRKEAPTNFFVFLDGRHYSGLPITAEGCQEGLRPALHIVGHHLTA
jgi:hypothetical protein